MKAFVIKNKEGKYWQFFYNDESEFVDEIYNAFMHYSKENAEKDIIDFDLKDCEVVEITIAEENLEHKIAVLERALKNTCWLLYGTYDEHYPNCFIEKAEKELKGEQQ